MKYNLNKSLIIKKLKAISLSNGLNFDEVQFKNDNALAMKDFALLYYLAASPRWPLGFGDGIKNRLNKINDFVSSNVFKDYNREYACFINKESMGKTVGKITNKALASTLATIVDKLKTNPEGMSLIYTKPSNKRTSDTVGSIVFHEWIHSLVDSNKLTNTKVTDADMYVEGLVIYFQYACGDYYGRNLSFIRKELSKINKIGEATLFDQALRYAAIFIHLLEEVEVSAARKKAIIKLFTELKNKPGVGRTE